MKYRLYHLAYPGLREKLPPTIEIYYDMTGRFFRTYTIIDEEMAVLVRLSTEIHPVPIPE